MDHSSTKLIKSKQYLNIDIGSDLVDTSTRFSSETTFFDHNFARLYHVSSKVKICHKQTNNANRIGKVRPTTNHVIHDASNSTCIGSNLLR
ncbi:hypothetical protein MTR_3g463650 [Medicago truncatula]|uniref:Uncharacterized protein n=1 Tax=Medicago truncatula TaxID=3880 RepID=A0A072UYQ7_MEDTR|nr:hypothetical protein MTR_3g463650 [Medicago truncatula]